MNATRSPSIHYPAPREVTVAQVTDKYSEYSSNGLTPDKLAEIFKRVILRQAERFEEVDGKVSHQSATEIRKNAVTGLDFEIIPGYDEPKRLDIGWIAISSFFDLFHPGKRYTM